MELKCVFSYEEESQDENIYMCTVKSASIIERNTTIKSIRGTHMEGRSNNDVEKIFFEKANIVKYFPRGLNNIFPGLDRLEISDCGLKTISRADLIGLENLMELYIENNLLTSLPNNLLQGMRDLKFVSFNRNKLKRLSSKLLKPLLANEPTYVGFQDNTNIDSFYDADNEEGSTNSLEQLMDIIDRNCGSPTWKQAVEIGNEKIWKSGKLSDFTIIAGGRSFKVHKIELAKHSSVFMTMFQDDTKETREGKMIIKDFSSEVIDEFLRYIYTGEIPDATNAMDLFDIAAKYDVPKLKSEIEKIILENLDASNVFEVLVLGNLYGSDEMKKLAFIELKKMFPDHKIPDVMMNQPELFRGVVEAQRAAYSQLTEIISRVI